MSAAALLMLEQLGRGTPPKFEDAPEDLSPGVPVAEAVDLIEVPRSTGGRRPRVGILHLVAPGGAAHCTQEGPVTKLIGLVSCPGCLGSFIVSEAQRLGAQITADCTGGKVSYLVPGVTGRFPSLVEASRVFLVKQMADLSLLLGTARLWVRG